ncbi:MAG: sn-glycerol-3-phosphate ABC transporter ATP-binding protein UgpC [Desulfobacterales bacterium]|nr:MAG: sn-glycerol-3-phosphate ABC transporter ATP-binding protein UgpC [Desulfobacterales bacterium]
MADVVLKKVRKTFGKSVAVSDIDLDVAHQEFLVLVGPSGCGKSTTLRMIAGLEDADSGDIYIGSQRVNDMAPKDRDVAMVFQNYALYPYATVYENMAFGLRVRRYPKDEIRRRVQAAADILFVRELFDRRPKQLSGGQRQRVAIGRAIVRDPKVFLFDEPLSNLDAKLRVQMRTEIKRIHQKVGTTIIYVTHDQVEAMTLAKRIVVMNAGQIEQIGSPQDMYERPQSRFVAGFIGSPSMNFIACRLIEANRRLEVQFGDGLTLPVPAVRTQSYRPYVGREMILGIRPEHCVEYRPHSEDSGMADLAVRVDVIEPLGMDTMIHYELAGKQICARVNPYSVNDVGEILQLTIDMNRMHLIDPTTDKVVKHDNKITAG